MPIFRRRNNVSCASVIFSRRWPATSIEPASKRSSAAPQVQKGGFARSGSAHDREKFAPRHREVHAFERRHRAITLLVNFAEPGDLDGVIHDRCIIGGWPGRRKRRRRPGASPSPGMADHTDSAQQNIIAGLESHKRDGVARRRIEVFGPCHRRLILAHLRLERRAG